VIFCCAHDYIIDNRLFPSRAQWVSATRIRKKTPRAIQSGIRLNYRLEMTRVGNEAITRTRIISPIDEGSAFLRDDTYSQAGKTQPPRFCSAAPRANICRRGAQWEEPSESVRRDVEDCLYAKLYVTQAYAPFDAPVRCLHRTTRNDEAYGVCTPTHVHLSNRGIQIGMMNNDGVD